MTDQEVNDIFTYHKPSGDQPRKYQRIRDYAKSLGLIINEECPESEDKRFALMYLQQAVMCANASIAIHDKA